MKISDRGLTFITRDNAFLSTVCKCNSSAGTDCTTVDHDFDLVLKIWNKRFYINALCIDRKFRSGGDNADLPPHGDGALLVKCEGKRRLPLSAFNRREI